MPARIGQNLQPAGSFPADFYEVSRLGTQVADRQPHRTATKNTDRKSQSHVFDLAPGKTAFVSESSTRQTLEVENVGTNVADK